MHENTLLNEPQPFLMLEKLIDDPQAVIKEFFTQFHLNNAQEFFWEICKGALVSPNYESAYKRSNLLFFAELMTQLFAAVQQIHAPEARGNILSHVEHEEIGEVRAQLKKLTSFFATHTLEELERDLDTWLKVALSTDNLQYQDSKERGNLLALNSQLRALLRSLYQLSSPVRQETSSL